jgi:hypothetical protein
MKNGIKQYFTILLAVIISSAYILLLVIQQLDEMLKEIKARIEHPEKLKAREESTSQFIKSVTSE